METEELKDNVEIIHGNKNFENFEENQNLDRIDSLYGLTKNRICESCENFEKCMPLGQSVRRCQACAKRKDLVEKKNSQDLRGEEWIEDERLERDYDSKDKPLTTSTSIEMTIIPKEHWNDDTKVLYNENFAVEHEHVDIHGIDIVRAPNPISTQDEKVVKKNENVLSNKKEYKLINVTESTLKKEKIGYSKGRFLLDKDAPIPNESREQTLEILDVQKTKEEIELEKKERGWIVNGRNASHLKVIPMKNVVMSDGYSPGKERRERLKVKLLKEKQDTQRILGLVAKRSESRMTSPTHKRNPNKLVDDEVEAPYTIGMTNNVPPSIIIHEKNPETLKTCEMHYEISTHNDSGSIHKENEGNTSCLKTNEEVIKPESYVIQQVVESKCSSPPNLSYCASDNLLYGTQRILELLAKRNGSRVTSPKQSLETSRIKEHEIINTKEDASREQHKIKNTNVFYSSTLHDQQQDLSIGMILPQKPKISYNDTDLLWNNIKETMLNSSPNYGIDLGAQIHDTHLKIEPNSTLSTNINCQFNDNPLYGTHRILGLISQRSESNITSPKRSLNFDIKEKEQSVNSNIKDKSLIYMKENEFSNLNDTMNMTNVAHPSPSKKNQEVTSSKVTHLNSTLCTHNESSHKNSEDIIEMTVHSNVEHKILKTQSEQDFLKQNSPISDFSTPSSTICHVKDNPLYGTKFENEPSNCTFNNANKNHLRTLNQSPLIIHSLVTKPLNNSIQEVSKNCNKEKCTTVLFKNSSNYDSSEMTSLYKSAVATPVCKSPEPSQKINKMLFQIESKVHTKEVEIVEDKSFLVPTCNVQLKNVINIDEEKNKKNNNKDEKYKLESNFFNTSNTKNMNILGNTKDGLKINNNEEKELIPHYNLKVSSSKNTSKGQIIFWLVHVLIKIFMYPFKLILRLILYFVFIIKTFVFGITKPFKILKNITFLGVSKLRSRILKHSQNGCNNSQGYSGCGCATKTYIFIVLSSLLLPSFFDLDFYLVNRFIERQVVIREALNFDYTKEHPIAIVNLLPQQIIGKAKGYFPNKEVMAAHAFPPSHIYHITVHLTIPESQYNHEIGMFQIVAETFSTRGHSLNKASRASMLRYHSPLVKYIKSVIMGIPIVLGLSQESQTLSIKVMESQHENEHSPTASVHINIEPKAGHLTGLGVPEIYHGELQVIAHNPYLREVARNWIWSLYVYSGLALFAFEALLVLCCCRRIFPQKFGGGNTTEEILTKEKKMVLEEGPKNMQAPRRLYRRHMYFPKSLSLALQSTSNVIEPKSVE